MDLINGVAGFMPFSPSSFEIGMQLSDGIGQPWVGQVIGNRFGEKRIQAF